MKLLFYICLIISLQMSCKADNKTNKEPETQEKNKIECTENGCSGTYIGFEFINGEDIAHQLSNKMSSSVGNANPFF